MRYKSFPAVVDCGGLSNPENGAITMSGTTYNSVATYSCNDGYNLVGDITRTCQANATWSGRDPSCESTIIGHKSTSARE